MNNKQQLIAQVEILAKLAKDLTENIQHVDEVGSEAQNLARNVEDSDSKKRGFSKQTIDKRRSRMREIHAKAAAYDKAVKEGKISPEL